MSKFNSYKPGEWELWQAVGGNDFERTMQLLEKGVSVQARYERDDWTVLMQACENKNKAIVDLLLKRGSSANDSDAREHTALMTAARQGDEEILDLLLEHNPNVMKKDWIQRTVIHYASFYNHKNILDRLLLPHPSTGSICWGSAVDVDDCSGRTPLWYAAAGGYEDCVDVLLVHGANPGHKDWKGESPLDIAKKNGHTTIVSMMTEILESPSRQYVISTISKLKEKIKRDEEKFRRQEMEIHRLKEDTEQLQEQLRQSVQQTETKLTAGKQQEHIQLEEVMAETSSTSVAVEGTDQPAGGTGTAHDSFCTLDTTVESSDGTVQPVTSSTSPKIGSEGGTVEFPSSDVSLVVPRGAVSSDVTFSLETYIHPDYLPRATCDDEVPLSPAFHLSSSLPQGHKFQNRLELSLPLQVPRIAHGCDSGWKVQLMINKCSDGVPRKTEWYPVLQLNTKTGESLKLDTESGELSAEPQSSFVYYDQDSGTIGLDHFCLLAWVGEALNEIGSMIGCNPIRLIDYAVFGKQIVNRECAWRIAFHTIHRSKDAFESLVRDLEKDGYVMLGYPTTEHIQSDGVVSVCIQCLEPWYRQQGKEESQINTKRIWASGQHSLCYYEVTIADSSCSADTLKCSIEVSFRAKGDKDAGCSVWFNISHPLQVTKTPEAGAAALLLPPTLDSEGKSSRTGDLLLNNKVYKAVLEHGAPQWSSIGLEIGLSNEMIETLTSDKPLYSCKLQAIIFRKFGQCGIKETEECLLRACETIPCPILGVVLDYIGGSSRVSEHQSVEDGDNNLNCEY